MSAHRIAVLVGSLRLFAENGKLASSLREFATKYIHAFAAWVETNTNK
jgi:hypothetical protein